MMVELLTADWWFIFTRRFIIRFQRMICANDKIVLTVQNLHRRQ